MMDNAPMTELQKIETAPKRWNEITEPGWYWAVDRLGARIVELDPEKHGDMDRIYWCGDEVGGRLSDWQDAVFIGPIPEPDALPDPT